MRARSLLVLALAAFAAADARAQEPDFEGAAALGEEDPFAGLGEGAFEAAADDEPGTVAEGSGTGTAEDGASAPPAQGAGSAADAGDADGSAHTRGLGSLKELPAPGLLGLGAALGLALALRRRGASP